MTQTKQKPQLPKFFLVFRIIAPILFVIGVILIIVSCTALAEYDRFYDLEPSLGCLFPGVICVFFSIPFTVIAYMPNIQRTMVKTSKYIMETSRDDLTDIATTGAEIGVEATEITAKAMATGVKEGLKDTKFCPECGREIDRDSKFCPECGHPQA